MIESLRKLRDAARKFYVREFRLEPLVWYLISSEQKRLDKDGYELKAEAGSKYKLAKEFFSQLYSQSPR